MNELSGRAESDPRIYLAAERTLLAWIRTGLALMGFGFVVARFGLFLHHLAMLDKPELPPTPLAHEMSTWFGVALVLLGVGVQVLGAAQYRGILALFDPEKKYRQPLWLFAIALCWALAAGGVTLALHILLHP